MNSRIYSNMFRSLAAACWPQVRGPRRPLVQAARPKNLRLSVAGGRRDEDAGLQRRSHSLLPLSTCDPCRSILKPLMPFYRKNRASLLTHLHPLFPGLSTLGHGLCVSSPRGDGPRRSQAVAPEGVQLHRRITGRL